MWVFENLTEIGASLSIVKMIKLACVIVEKRKTLSGQSSSRQLLVQQQANELEPSFQEHHMLPCSQKG
jgi:hypothetical protein